MTSIWLRKFEFYISIHALQTPALTVDNAKYKASSTNLTEIIIIRPLRLIRSDQTNKLFHLVVVYSLEMERIYNKGPK